jgi:hypothetical protein
MPAPRRRLAGLLLAASFVVLSQELTLIRWLPGQVRVLAYYPNLILLAAFLGLGVGCLCAGRRPLLVWWPPLLLANVVAAAALGRVVFSQESTSEHLFLLYYDLPRNAPAVADIRVPIVLFFVLGGLAFVPLGQFVAERLKEFRAQSRALRGYAFDLLGSLLGVVGFAVLAFHGATPAVWFAVIVALGAPLLATRSLGLATLAACGAAILATVTASERADRYSPYYALGRKARPDGGFDLLANGSLHQVALPLRRDDPAPGDIAVVRRGYHLPYRMLQSPPRRALVVGAGTGNDVAVLLDEGAEAVDAVEIDPVILALGREHPDRPYDSPRVRVINADARSFLNDTSRTYDLIVFGTLDSMTRLSALSSARLDTFMYTVECIRTARSRLAPGGGLVLYFMSATPYIDARLEAILAAAFGEPPYTNREFFRLFNRIFMAGPAFSRIPAAQHAAPVAAVELPTDDWPFLYLARRGLSAFYLSVAGMLGMISVLAVLAVSPRMRRDWGRVDWPMFLLGLAFLLLETRAVTAINLLWGSTWITSAVVFGSILATLLAATLLAERWTIGPGAAGAGLSLTLLIGILVPVSRLLTVDPLARLALSAALVAAPIFVAGLLFAALFRARDAVDLAFGWNLMGAVAGGLLDLASMAVGLRALLLVALCAYLLAIALAARSGWGARSRVAGGATARAS